MDILSSSTGFLSPLGQKGMMGTEFIPSEKKLQETENRVKEVIRVINPDFARVSAEAPDRRWEAFVDLIYFAGGIVYCLAMKVYEAVANCFNINMHDTPYPSNPINSIALATDTDTYVQPSEIPSDGIIPYEQSAKHIFRCCRDAIQTLPKGLVEDFFTHYITSINSFDNNLMNNPGSTSLKNIPKFFERNLLLAGATKEQIGKFKQEVLKAQGMNVPKVITRDFTLQDPNTQKDLFIRESSLNLDCELGAKYLEATKKNYTKEIAYIRKHKNGVRTSREKKSSEAQGMIVNGRLQDIGIKDSENSVSILRSGVFAVHDNAKVGLSVLRARNIRDPNKIKAIEIEIKKLKWVEPKSFDKIDIEKFKLEMFEATWFREKYPDALNFVEAEKEIETEIGYFKEFLSDHFQLHEVTPQSDKSTQERRLEGKKPIRKKELRKQLAFESKIAAKHGDEYIRRKINKLELEIVDEVQDRTDLVVAQALPKIVASIKEMVKDRKSIQNAIQAGSFLHVEQSFLSDEATDELVMIQDMQGALDHIRENTTVKLTTDPKEETVTVDQDGKITLILCVSEFDIPKEYEYPKEGLGITSLFFTQGVNEHQSLGHLFSLDTKASYQNEVNLRSLSLMQDYAKKIPGAIKKVDELTAHYSTAKHRRAKDMVGVRLIDHTVRDLGGKRGVVCKSGKDRTGAEVNYALADNFIEFLSPKNPSGIKSKEQLAKEKQSSEAVRIELSGGISLINAEQNTGRRVYVVNAGQHKTWPEEWRPPLEFCNPDLTGET